jgi:putative membrane protein
MQNRLITASKYINMIKKSATLLLKGIAMGAADVVPGVSGGTIAFITGIYEELLATIAGINLNTFKSLKTDGLVGFWKAVNGKFLLPLLAGIAISIISLAHAVTYALANHPLLVWGFFFGLVIASAVLIGKTIKRWNFKLIFSLVLGAAFAFWITTLNPGAGSNQLWYVFISGVLAICAMILPGISGAFILLLLGSYNTVLTAIKSLDITVAAVFAAGCITGLLSISKLLSWAFKHYNNIMISVLTGFLIGSLNKLWPWKEILSTRVNSHGETVPFIQTNVSPIHFETVTNEPNQMLAVILMAIAGIVLVLGLEFIGTRWNKK